MKFSEGCIGRQENASIIAIGAASSMIFTVESATAYENGNSTYISLPASILISLVVFLLVVYVMGKCRKHSLCELIRFSLGAVAEKVYAAALVFVLFVNAFMLAERFANMIHSFVFPGGDYAVIVFYIAAVIGVCAFKGFECIGRLAKCLGLSVLIVMLITYAAASRSFEIYRLFPLLGNGAQTVIKQGIRGVFTAMPAFLGALCFVDSAQGIKPLKSAGMIGGLCAAAVTFVTQLVIGLTFSYKELGNMYAPLYRINTMTATESTFLRYDKAMLFFWLAAAFVAMAFYVYYAASVVAKATNADNARPFTTVITVAAACLLAAESESLYGIIRSTVEFLKCYGAIILLMPAIVAAVIGIIRVQIKKPKMEGKSAEDV